MENSKLELNESIFVAGHRGMVGAAILRHLQEKRFQNLLTATRNELDLRQGTQRMLGAGEGIR